MQVLFYDVKKMVARHIPNFLSSRDRHDFAFNLKNWCTIFLLDAEGVTCQRKDVLFQNDGCGVGLHAVVEDADQCSSWILACLWVTIVYWLVLAVWLLLLTKLMLLLTVRLLLLCVWLLVAGLGVLSVAGHSACAVSPGC